MPSLSHTLHLHNVHAENVVNPFEFLDVACLADHCHHPIDSRI